MLAGVRYVLTDPHQVRADVQLSWSRSMFSICITSTGQRVNKSYFIISVACDCIFDVCENKALQKWSWFAGFWCAHKTTPTGLPKACNIKRPTLLWMNLTPYAQPLQHFQTGRGGKFEQASAGFKRVAFRVWFSGIRKDIVFANVIEP